MSYGYSVHGVFVFTTSDACKRAVASARDLVDSEDTAFGEAAAGSWRSWFRVDGASLHVEIELSGPGDWWFAIEGLVEEVSDAAAEGFVDARHEAARGLITRYFAGGRDEDLEDRALTRA